MIGLDWWDWYQSKILDVGTKLFPDPLDSIDWVLSRLFSSQGTSKKQKNYQFWRLKGCSCKSGKFLDLKCVLSQGPDVYRLCCLLRVSYPALLSAVAVPLSSCCRDPSVCSKLKLPPSADGPDGLPPIDGIVGLQQQYQPYAQIVHTWPCSTPTQPSV